MPTSNTINIGDLVINDSVVNSGDRVFITTPDKLNGVTSIVNTGNGNCILSTNINEWKQFIITKTSTNIYTISDENNNYLRVSDANRVTFNDDESISKEFKFNSDGHIESSIYYRALKKNGNFIRFYSSNFPYMLLYKVDSSEPPIVIDKLSNINIYKDNSFKKTHANIYKNNEFKTCNVYKYINGEFIKI